jgi:hypothetical protein
MGISAGGILSDRWTKDRTVRCMFLLGGFYCLAAPFLLIFLGNPALGLLAACIFVSSLLRSLGGQMKALSDATF